jgi:hypothetical protein
MTTRQQLANLWREAAQITRKDIFGPRDALRPVYSLKDNILTDQIDIPAVGMVGPNYGGKLAILSVNGAGGKDNSLSLPSSDRMYAAFRHLRDATPGAPALAAFEALNTAVIASIPDWGVAKQHTQKILDAAQKSLDDIAYLYLVPFRTRGDAGSTMDQAYLDAGYSRHLVQQLRAVAPKIIIAIDRPSERASHRYRREAPHTNVIYYTRRRDAHAERTKTLAALSLQCAR